MFKIKTKYNEPVKIFAETIEDKALVQIIEMANSPLGENAHIRIMADAHSGKGCVIGTTMNITDKVCPNLVGVDIGCSVVLAKFSNSFEDKLEELDKAIKKVVPSGFNVFKEENPKAKVIIEKLRCKDFINVKRALYSLGTLGTGNHYLEAYPNGYLSVHTGSRNLGVEVAKYYQSIAEKKCFSQEEKRKTLITELITRGRQKDIENEIKKIAPIKMPKELAFLTGQDMEDYLYDIELVQEYAKLNSETILENIAKEMRIDILNKWRSTHNYIDVENKILRKGAISAKEGETILIPLNMRDGILICEGLGNPDWNYSAPHGAGRLYSRSAAKQSFSLDEFKKSMEGIYSTTITQETIDEAPFVYKDYREIMRLIEPTVKIKKRLIPIYNFKAGNNKF